MEQTQREALENQQWDSASIGSNLGHQIFYLLIKISGRRAAYFLLYIVVFWYVLFYPSIRTKAGYYLHHRFPEQTRLASFKHCYLMCLMLGKALVDRAIVGILGPQAMAVKLHGERALLDLLTEDKGLILMNAHAGCWQAAMSAMTLVNTPVSMLMLQEEGDIDRHYFEHAGMESPYNIIDPRSYMGGALEMLNVLKRNEILSVMGDRVLGNPKNTVRVPFLGEEASFPISAYRLAAATGAPIAVLLSYKTGPASYELSLARVIRVEEGTGKKNADLTPKVAEFVDTIEEYCQAHPYQFFNFFDMWEDLQ